ncbi:MAG: hypothetical protein V3U28_04810 [Candidatus Acidoferrales bacterium]
MSAPGTLSAAAATALGAALLVGGLAGTTVYRYGAVKVYVEEKRPAGESVRLWVPGVLVPAAMTFVPDRHLKKIPPEARRFLPALRVASEELARCPDFRLLEVKSRRQRVSIAKRDGALVIDVDNQDESVHVSIPLRLLASLAEHLEEAATD